MITADAVTSAALEARVKGAVFLVEAEFRDGTLCCNTSGVDLHIGGNNYLGFGYLVEFPQLKETEDQMPSKMTLKFGLTKQSLLAATLGDAAVYRGRPIRIYMQLMTEDFIPVGSKMLRWRGAMDKVSTSKESDAKSELKGKIHLDCVRPGLGRVRNNEGRRLTHKQHVLKHPNDKALEYMQGLVDTPKPWVTIDFQKVD